MKLRFMARMFWLGCILLGCTGHQGLMAPLEPAARVEPTLLLPSDALPLDFQQSFNDDDFYVCTVLRREQDLQRVFVCWEQRAFIHDRPQRPRPPGPLLLEVDFFKRVCP